MFQDANEQNVCLLNDEQCIIRHTLIDLDPVELKYYQFMVSLDKCTGSCNVLSPKIYVSKEIKDINVKAFNMMTNKIEAKAKTKHISCDCKCKFNSTKCNWNRKWSDETCHYECKNYHKSKNDYSWNPSTDICENNKYLRITSIADASVIACDEIIYVMELVSAKRQIL